MIFQTFSLSLVLPILISLVLHYLNAYLKMHLKVRSFESKESPFFAKRMLQKHTFYFVLFQLVNIVAIYFILLIFQKVYTPYEIGKHTSELQSRGHLVCRLLLEKKNK